MVVRELQARNMPVALLTLPTSNVLTSSDVSRLQPRNMPFMFVTSLVFRCSSPSIAASELKV